MSLRERAASLGSVRISRPASLCIRFVDHTQAAEALEESLALDASLGLPEQVASR